MGYMGKEVLGMEFPGRRERGRPRRKFVVVRENMELVGVMGGGCGRRKWREVLRSALAIPKSVLSQERKRFVKDANVEEWHSPFVF